MWANRIRVGYRDVLYPHLIAVPINLQKVPFGLERLLVKIGEEVPAADLMLAPNVVHLDHELVVGLMLARAQVSDLIAGAVGQWNFVQKELRHGAQPGCRNLVPWDRKV